MRAAPITPSMRNDAPESQPMTPTPSWPQWEYVRFGPKADIGPPIHCNIDHLHRQMSNLFPLPLERAVLMQLFLCPAGTKNPSGHRDAGNNHGIDPIGTTSPEGYSDTLNRHWYWECWVG